MLKDLRRGCGRSWASSGLARGGGGRGLGRAQPVAVEGDRPPGRRRLRSVDGASQDPLVLVRQGRSVVDRLRGSGLLTPKSAHLSLDAESLATSVESRGPWRPPWAL